MNDLSEKKVLGKKINILAKYVNSKENFKSKPKLFCVKRPIFWCIPIQAVEVKMLGLFFTKYILSEKKIRLHYKHR